MLSGIKNHGNLCFLNAILWGLASSWNMNVENKCLFEQYLKQTLQYIMNNEYEKDIALFIIELQKVCPQLFNGFEQEGQDALEALNMIVTTAQIDDDFHFYNYDSIEYENPLKQHILIFDDWKNMRIYCVNKNIFDDWDLEIIQRTDKPNNFLKANNLECTNWKIGDQLKFENYQYIIQNQIEGDILYIQLQYVENDQLIDIQYLRLLKIDDIYTYPQLHAAIKEQLQVDIDFDIAFDGQLMYAQDQAFDIYEYQGQILNVIFRTKDLAEFLICKNWNTPTDILNLKKNNPAQVNYDGKVLVFYKQLKHLYAPPMSIKGIERTYHLKSVCSHVGDYGGGHYVSNSNIFGQWLFLDDLEVRQESIGITSYEYGYLYFYS